MAGYIQGWGVAESTGSPLGSYLPHQQFYDPYSSLVQQQAQAQVYQPITSKKVAEPQVAAPTECSEFAWLRKRVNEILWK